MASASAWAPWVAGFTERLRDLGCIEGRTVTIQYRWAEGRSERFAEIAAELIQLKVDVIVTAGAAVLAAKQATTVIPIVFAVAPDPVGAGFVESLARPGGNVTGFTTFEYGMSGKYLELLKEIAPRVTRAAVLRDATDPAGIGQWAAIQSMAPSLGVEVILVALRDAREIDRAITAFASGSNGGLIVTGSAPAAVHRDLIIASAARHRLPAVYPYPFFASSGGLISYGPDTIDQYRRAASYVDRILRGEKPADLPVQAPTKYELVINLKTAKTLGLEVPPTLLARADEVIE